MTEDLEERLIEGLGELKRLGQEMIRQQNITNRRVTKVEQWQAAHDLVEAKANGVQQGRSEAFVTKSQVAAIGTIAGVVMSLVSLGVRFL